MRRTIYWDTETQEEVFIVKEIDKKLVIVERLKDHVQYRVKRDELSFCRYI